MSSDSATPSDRKRETLERHHEATAEVLPEEVGLFVGGEFVEAESGETFGTYDPTTGEELATVPAGGAADVDRAVAAAREAVEGEWGEFDATDRQKALTEIADRVEERADEFATLVTLDNGKAIREATADVYAVADHFRYFAGATRVDEGTTVPAGEKRSIQTIREPVGVVGAITPWNFPLLIASWKLAPALAAGNAVVWKPAEETPLAALEFCALVRDVLPDGTVNAVTGFGEEAGEPLTEHPDVDKLAFTGSTPVGKQVMKKAAENVTDVTLELGGKSPVVVFPDADLGSAAFTAFLAIFYNTGETCTAGSRMFVHEDVYDEFLEQLKGVAEGTDVGDPLLEETDVGPKVSQEQVERVERFVDIAREEGGDVVTGGGRPDDEALADGSFYEPTVIESLDHDSEPVQEEIFGPVLSVFEWDDYDEMIELANDVDYGLAAGVLTSDLKQAMKTARDIEAGTIWVNQYQDYPTGMPFGGYKESGIGRERAFSTLDHYTETKAVDISLR